METSPSLEALRYICGFFLLKLGETLRLARPAPPRSSVVLAKCKRELVFVLNAAARHAQQVDRFYATCACQSPQERVAPDNHSAKLDQTTLAVLILANRMYPAASSFPRLFPMQLCLSRSMPARRNLPGRRIGCESICNGGGGCPHFKPSPHGGEDLAVFHIPRLDHLLLGAAEQSRGARGRERGKPTHLHATQFRI